MYKKDKMDLPEKEMVETSRRENEGYEAHS